MENNLFTPLFHFLHEEVSILEVKKNGLAKNADKDQVFHWIKIVKATDETSRLEFISMSDEVVNGNQINIRAFKGAELRFDKDFAKFSQNGNSHILKNNPVSEISQDINKAVIHYLSK